MSMFDYDDKRSRERARQDVDSLASAVNLWLAIGLLDMAKSSRNHQAENLQSYLAGFGFDDEEATPQDDNDYDRAWDHYPR